MAVITDNHQAVARLYAYRKGKTTKSVCRFVCSKCPESITATAAEYFSAGWEFQYGKTFCAECSKELKGFCYV